MTARDAQAENQLPRESLDGNEGRRKRKEM
jgi:hypothetical protein